jgi:protein-S-isoprenylcysteine O-methyltransferase Ste14
VTQKIAIEFEEKILAEKFGRRYRDYSKKVRRWF